MTHPHFPAATLQIARDGFKNHIASIHAMTVTEDPCAWAMRVCSARSWPNTPRPSRSSWRTTTSACRAPASRL